MWQTDRRQTKASLNASTLWGRRHNKFNRMTVETVLCCILLYCVNTIILNFAPWFCSFWIFKAVEWMECCDWLVSLTICSYYYFTTSLSESQMIYLWFECILHGIIFSYLPFVNQLKCTLVKKTWPLNFKSEMSKIPFDCQLSVAVMCATAKSTLFNLLTNC